MILSDVFLSSSEEGVREALLALMVPACQRWEWEQVSWLLSFFFNTRLAFAGQSGESCLELV